MTATAAKAMLLLSLTIFLGVSCNTYLSNNNMAFSTADLSGMIYDGDNQACPGVRISLDGASGPISDINGHFLLPTISRGKHVISMTKDKHETADFEIEFLNRSQIVYLKIYSHYQILQLAEKSLAERKLAEAEAFLARAAKIDPTDPLLLFLQASVALKRRQPQEAAALLQTIIDQQTAEPPVYLALADIYEYQLNDKPKALAYLKKYAQAVENDEVASRIKKLEGQE